MNTQAFILFDDVSQKRAILLQSFAYQNQLQTNHLAQLETVLQRGWQQGLHCALLADYEWGLAWQKLSERNPFSGCLKIDWFENQTVLDDAATWLAQQAGSAPTGISSPEWDTSEADYHQAIENIHEAIRRGETYQINYTIRLKTNTYGNPIRLYQRLRQNVPYGALAHLPDGNWVLCFSPELFLNIQNNGLITTEPMKGTAPILDDGHDTERAEQLRHDPKNRAENTMIVDLLRNDLGKLAQIGGVSVPESFKISRFGAVWQMTSVVQAQLKQGVHMADLFQAAFPCGSITGAPKRQSMLIIQALENSPRGLYTGSLGFLNPEPDSPLGFSGCLNVLIRTLILQPKTGNSQEYTGTYGVGSGIVIDSQAADEYAECGWKARFLSQLRPEFDLWETMRVEKGEVVLWPYHLSRLTKSAQELNFPFKIKEANELINQTAARLPSHQTHRLKLILQPTGQLKTEVAPLEPIARTQKLVIYPQALPNHDPLRRHKTSYRPHQDAAWQWASEQGAFDALCFNENGHLLEGGRSSILILHENKWLTPTLDLDILPGVLRQATLQKGHIHETQITREMLHQAAAIQVGNALRGWFSGCLKKPDKSNN